MNKKEFSKLLKEAKGGDARAMYLVALEYENGEVVRADGEKALYWMNKSADLEDKDAYDWLRQYYFEDGADALEMLRG